MSALLELRGVGRSFGALKAVDGVDLDVESGARHALIGPNGAGKSTLFRLISGEMPVTSGTVTLSGDDVTKLSQVRRARRGLAQTMQHSSLFLTQTAAQNVALAAQRHRGTATVAAAAAAARCRCPGHRTAGRGRPVGAGARCRSPSLSHGERRQLEIAVALACEPRLLLMDEPAAGMSPAESGRLTELVLALPREITVVIVEHDLDVVFALAERVTVLHLGQVLLTGSPDEVRGSAAVQEAYLGSSTRGELFDPPVPLRLKAALCRTYWHRVALESSLVGEWLVTLQITGLTSGYGRSSVLQGVDLDVPDGRVLGLLGRNGVGKTTLIHTVMGLVRPTGGSITLDGKELAGPAYRPDRPGRTGAGAAGTPDLAEPRRHRTPGPGLPTRWRYGHLDGAEDPGVAAATG
ncbi:MAG: ATP-binding cassette domain-containing protein [Geodermatophilaceae bacterium]